jgi:peptidyl-prolyl cis-trans isomerase A (cyclophilin A)
MKTAMKSLLACVALFASLVQAVPAIAAAPAPAKAAAPKVEMKTSEGTVVIEFYPDKAPLSVENFMQYVRAGFYNGTIFHRVIDGFMIQGGGLDANMSEKRTRAPISNEAGNGLKNSAGTIAMARTGNPHSATGQFFINLVDNQNLDYPSFDGWGYAVFGKVVKGFDVVQKIGKTPTGFQDVPRTPITIISVSVVPETK